MIRGFVDNFIKTGGPRAFLLGSFVKRIQRNQEAREAERARLENTQRNTFFSVLGAAQRRADALRAETLNAELNQEPAAPEEVRVETGSQQANITARRRRSGGASTSLRI